MLVGEKCVGYEPWMSKYIEKVETTNRPTLYYAYEPGEKLSMDSVAFYASSNFQQVVNMLKAHKYGC